MTNLADFIQSVRKGLAFLEAKRTQQEELSSHHQRKINALEDEVSGLSEVNDALCEAVKGLMAETSRLRNLVEPPTE